MLAPIQHILAKKRLVLASKSPRRQELLRSLVSQTEDLEKMYIE